MIDNIIKNFIKNHSEESYPNEACGFIIEKNFKFLCVKCFNVSKNPNTSFEIAPIEYLKIKSNCDKIHYIYHSHPQASDYCSFSEKDKNCSEALDIPIILMCMKSNEFKIFDNSGLDSRYIGRYYKEGKYDCFSLIIDYFKNEKSFDIKYDKKSYIENVLEDNYLEKEFKKIFLRNNFSLINRDKEIIRDDILLFDEFNNSSPKHLGLYLGQESFLHQPYSKLSRVENNWHKYKNKIHSIFRLYI
jgi:proteasome lid subunit RPN8/RPN11